MLISNVFMENPFVNSLLHPMARLYNISGFALYMCHVVLEIAYVIKIQYNVTRSNKKVHLSCL